MLAERLACEFTVLPQLVSSILEMWMWGFFLYLDFSLEKMDGRQQTAQNTEFMLKP